jgi:hypothetical protein
VLTMASQVFVFVGWFSVGTRIVNFYHTLCYRGSCSCFVGSVICPCSAPCIAHYCISIAPSDTGQPVAFVAFPPLGNQLVRGQWAVCAYDLQ